MKNIRHIKNTQLIKSIQHFKNIKHQKIFKVCSHDYYNILAILFSAIISIRCILFLRKTFLYIYCIIGRTMQLWLVFGKKTWFWDSLVFMLLKLSDHHKNLFLRHYNIGIKAVAKQRHEDKILSKLENLRHWSRLFSEALTKFCKAR